MRAPVQAPVFYCTGGLFFLFCTLHPETNDSAIHSMFTHLPVLPPVAGPEKKRQLPAAHPQGQLSHQNRRHPRRTGLAGSGSGHRLFHDPADGHQLRQGADRRAHGVRPAEHLPAGGKLQRRAGPVHGGIAAPRLRLPQKRQLPPVHGSVRRPDQRFLLRRQRSGSAMGRADVRRRESGP